MRKLEIRIKDREVYDFIKNEFMGQLSDGHYENSSSIGFGPGVLIWQAIDDDNIIFDPTLEQEGLVTVDGEVFPSVKEAFKKFSLYNNVGSPSRMISIWKKEGYSFVCSAGRFNEKAHSWDEVTSIAKKASKFWNGR